MSRLTERIALATGLLCAVAPLVDAVLAQKTGLVVLRALLPFFFWALALAAVAAVRARLARLAEEEKRDEALARTERPDSALFEKKDDDLLWIGRSREQFEKFVVPAVAPLIAVALGTWSWNLFRSLPLLVAAPAERLVAAAFLGGQAFLFFLLGRYLTGLAREQGQRILRGAGLAVGVTAVASAAAMVAALVAEFAAPTADRYAAVLLLAFLGLVAAENALRALFALYSPRRSEAFSAASESRLAALLADPKAWTNELAQAVDYQFGFKISDTWFYRFLESALLPLVIVQLCVLYLMSCLVFLGPEEQGILEHFGKPVEGRWLLDSGAHLKLPWPFETVRRFPSRRLLSVPVGYTPDTNAAPRVLVWTIPHFRAEDLFLTASRSGPAPSAAGASVPVNLVTVNIPVEYRVTNLFAYAYDFIDPAATLRHAAYRALTREMSRRDLAELMAEDRLEIAGKLREAVQADADRLGLGVEITLVSLQGIHPPVPVADAFESVVGASEEREAKILAAQAYTNRVLPVAAANAVRVAREAEAYRVRRTEIASAEAEQFERRLAAFHTSPLVFKSRAYLGALRDTLSPIRKYIIDAPASQEVITFNMEDKPLSGLFDMGLTPPGESEGLRK